MMSDESEDEIGFDDGFDEDVPFDDFDDDGSSSSFSELVKENPLVKLGIVAAALGMVVMVFILFGGDSTDAPGSLMRAGSNVTEVPASGEVSQNFQEAVEEVNERQVEEAIKTGTSAIPVPITPPKGVVKIEPPQEKEEDPLARWRRLQEQRKEAQQQQQTIAPAPTNAQAAQEAANAETISALANAMAAQMQTVLEANNPQSSQIQQITAGDYFEKIAEEEAAAQAQAVAQQETQQEIIQNIIIPAGEIEYAQLLTEANSEAQAPILGQIVSGPLAGSRIIGSFSTGEDFLTLNFNTVVIDGVAQPMQALAVDPVTTTPGLVTDIDRRYFRRVVLPAAASFIEGLAEGIADQGTTTVTVSGDTVVDEQDDLNSREEFFNALGEAAEEVGEIVGDEGEDIEPLIIVAPGTPMGLIFLQPVLEQVQ